jgi:hypothetical protein
MAVLLNRPYGTTPTNTVVELTVELETALIAQGLASSALSTAITTGAQSSSFYTGTVAIAAGTSSAVVTSPLVNANSKVFAVVAQAAADGTLLRVERVVSAAGSFTIYGTANATATTYIDWAIITTPGFTPAQ